MKKYIRFSTIAFIILVLLLATFPASAKATKTTVTGTMQFLGEPEPDPDGWGNDVGREILPGWWTINQCRNDTQYFEITTESQLDGYQTIEINCTFLWDLEGNLLRAHLWGKSTIFEDPEKTEPKWNCTSEGGINSDWNFSMDVVCQGVGDAKGLSARFLVGNSDDGVTYPVNGYIIDPGG